MVTASGGDVKQPSVDLCQAQLWLDELHGDSPGFIHVCSTGNWSGQVCATSDEFVAYIRMMDAREASGIYVRATTVKDYLPKGSRGSAADTCSLSALWADIDVAGPGHKTEKQLPPTEDDAFNLVSESGLLVPTRWIRSGWGLYPIWLLREPHVVDDLPMVKELSKSWHKVLAVIADQLGWFYGAETADLARVLRIPGTVNRKVPGDHRLCELTTRGSGTLYTLDELCNSVYSALERLPKPEPKPTVIQSVPLPSPPTGPTVEGVSPGTDYESKVGWSDVLVPYGWVVHHQQDSTTYWTRPGKDPLQGWSATTGYSPDGDRLYVFSSSTPFKPEEPYNKFAAYALLNHGGDYGAAAAALRARGYGDGPPPSQELEVFKPSSDLVKQQDSVDLLPSPDTLRKLSKKLIEEFWTDPDGKFTLKFWRECWYLWNGFVWSEAELAHIEQIICNRLENAFYLKRGKNGPEEAPWPINRNRLKDITYVLGRTDEIFLKTETEHLSWLDGSSRGQAIGFSNGVLEVETRKLHNPDPNFFNLVGIPFDYDPDAPEPAQWLKFLNDLWPESPNSIRSLQQWFGYVLSGRTDFQKVFMLLGPTRSGKGTIVRILQRLVGKGNYTGLALSSFSSQFGLQTLIDKSLAVVSDARVDRADNSTLVERLLNIAGEDATQIPRKYKTDWNDKVPARLMIVSNEPPYLVDASGAVIGRFVVANIRESWQGKEDLGLEGRLVQELPGILNWALDGLDDLLEQGQFTDPDQFEEIVESMSEVASPVKAFLKEEAEFGASYQVSQQEVFHRWEQWCNNSRRSAGSLQAFCRSLRTAYPRVRRVRPRGADGKQRGMFEGIRLRSAEIGGLMPMNQLGGGDD